MVSYNAAGSWLLGFASPGYKFNKGENAAIDVIFDGQEQARLFAKANQSNMLTSIMPPNVARDFRRSSLMVALARDAPVQFNLTSTGPMMATLANCVARIKSDGINSAGDFTAPKPVVAKPAQSTVSVQIEGIGRSEAREAEGASGEYPEPAVIHDHAACMQRESAERRAQNGDHRKHPCVRACFCLEFLR